MTSALLVPASDIEAYDGAERRKAYAARAKADGTWTVYEGHWTRFARFAAEHGKPPGPPTDPGLLADYIIRLRELGRAAATISVAVAAIAHRNRASAAPSPLDHPQVKEVLAGARRLAARAQAGRGAADPLLPAELRSFIAHLKPGLVGQRDMALLTFGLAGGFRREELARLTVENLRFDHDRSILVTLPWSKGDQEGEGHVRRICPGDTLELCPVTAVKIWLGASGVTEGPLFRPVARQKALARPMSPRRIDQVVREYTRRALKEHPEAFMGKKYSAHSLRAGLCTAAALAGKAEHEIRAHVGHKSAQSTARYIRIANVQKSTLTRGIGL